MLRLLLSMIIYILVQVLIIKDVALFNTAFCFLYLLPLLLIPYDTPRLLVLLIAFVAGMLVDVFYNTVGFNAAAVVAMAFLRHYWIGLLAPSGGYDVGATLKVSRMGIQWFSSYSIPLIFVYTLVLFCIEAGGLNMFGRSLLNAFSSTLLTFVAIVISQYLFHFSKQ